MPTTDTGHPLDNAVLAALTGPQSGSAVVQGPVRRFPQEVSPFLALPDEPDAAAWSAARDLIARTGPGWVLRPGELVPPAGLGVIRTFRVVQMTSPGLTSGTGSASMVPLGADDVPDMLDLTARTEPGPFLPRTIEMGRYVGVRIGEALAAMAGERLRLPGWTEISAVCTDPAFRGRGLAERLVRAVAAGAAARGDQVFLHALDTNTGAIRLYERLGLTIRCELTITGLQVHAG